MTKHDELQSLKGLLRQDFTREAIGPKKDIISLCPMFKADFDRLQELIAELSLPTVMERAL